MKLKGIIDCDFINYKEPVMTLEMPYCDFKCDKLNGCQVCQNISLAREPDIEVSEHTIWNMYKNNPITKGFCLQGLEPLDSEMELYNFVDFIRAGQFCDDIIIIYTGYNREEKEEVRDILKNYHNIIIKWGRYLINQPSHYDELLGVNLASQNQYAEWIK